MSSRDHFFVGPFLRVTVPVREEQRQVGSFCPDSDCGRGKNVPFDACFCPGCGGETEDLVLPKEEWDDPSGDEQEDYDPFNEELTTTDGMSDPDTENLDGRKVKRFLYVSNTGGVPGGSVEGTKGEPFQLIGPRLIDLSVKAFLKVHRDRLDNLRATYGSENVEVLYGAVLCYR